MLEANFFRVEDTDGEGYYRTEFRALGVAGYSNRHPAPCDDNLSDRFISGHHFFGFKSVNALRKWFDCIADQIKDEIDFQKVMKNPNELFVSFYFSSARIDGNRQSISARKDMTLIKKVKFEEFFS